MLFSLRELLAPDACPAGLLIRAPDIAVATLAGLQIPADVCPTLRRRVRDLWSEARAQAGGQIWLAGMPPTSAWRSRVTSLANVGYMGPWGALNPQRQLGGPGPGPGWGQSDDRECPVCLDEYFEFLPHPHRRGRRVGAFGCPHALCNECSDALSGAPNDRCPLCRAGRV